MESRDSLEACQDILFILIQFVEKWLHRLQLVIAHTLYRHDPVLQGYYDEVVALANTRGFKFVAPPVGLSRKRWALLYRHESAAFHPTLGPSGTIVFNRQQFRLCQKHEGLVQLILAHELGHAIDHQFPRRSKHPFLAKMKKFDKKKAEIFAWAFTAYLYGVDTTMPYVIKDPRVSEKEFKKICVW